MAPPSFPDWRRRVFEALVRDKGFTVYAVEVGWPDALALDDYVVNGRGDPVAAIHALTTWKDETTETLALVTWMRAYNADPKHARKVHFEGFDVYTPHAVPRILSYLAKVDPSASDEARATLAPFADVGCDSTYPALPEEKRAQVTKAVDALMTRTDAKHGVYAAKSSEEEWVRAQAAPDRPAGDDVLRRLGGRAAIRRWPRTSGGSSGIIPARRSCSTRTTTTSRPSPTSAI